MDDGSTQYIELFNTKNNEWCKNEFQVTHQVTMVGKYENRYDVTYQRAATCSNRT